MSKCKKLCKWKKEDFETDFEKLADAVRKSKYVCIKCGRAARKEKWLCEAKSVKFE
jgi:hypothetical protein